MQIANKTLREVEISGDLTQTNVVNKLIRLVDQYNILTAIQKISNECTATLSYDGEKYIINLEPKKAVS